MILFLDFETYYDKEYSLREMTAPEYILDDRFEMIICAVARDNEPTMVLSEPELRKFLQGVSPDETITVSHNALFDACVLGWRYGFVPDRMLCTLSMARCLLGHCLKNLNLHAVSSFLGLGAKGDTIQKVKGMRKDDIIQAGMMDDFVEYCRNDNDLCRGIFGKLVGAMPAEQLRMIDRVTRCAVQPRLVIDRPRLQAHLENVRGEKTRLLAACGVDKGTLMSAPQFQQELERRGIEVEMKPGKLGPIPAVAKTDLFMVGLQEHADVEIQTLAAARLGLRSTLEESRAEKLLAISALPWAQPGSMPIPLRYAGAHTHRLSGEWKINMQNLPRATTGGSQIRKCVVAPPGCSIVVCDLGQIEARLVAWQAGASTLVAQFANKWDPYARLAESIFGYPIDRKVQIAEGFVGKSCISGGTLVYTNRGLIPIERVTRADQLWDGEEWICHSGVVFNGIRQTLPLCGVWLTPDHLVWSGTTWKRADLVQVDASILSQALVYAADTLLSPVIFEARMGDLVRSSLRAIAGRGNIRLTDLTLKVLKALAVLPVPNLQLLANAGGNTRRQCRTINIALDCLIACLPPLCGVTHQAVAPSRITAVAVSQFHESGETTGRYFSATCKPSRGGMIQRGKWIAKTMLGIMSRAIFGSVPRQRIGQTGEPLRPSKRKLPVYDILSAGARNRFMIHTDRGPLVVHNCVLGLGYGLGAKNFFIKTRAAARGQKIDLGKLFTQDLADRAVKTYRKDNREIPEFWYYLSGVLNSAFVGKSAAVQVGPVEIGEGYVQLPDRLVLQYDEPQSTSGEASYRHPVYGTQQRIWGGHFLENITQALAGQLIRDAWLRLDTLGYRAVWQVHDELIYVVADTELEEAKKVIHREMVRCPKWAPDLPLSADIGSGKDYGSCK